MTTLKEHPQEFQIRKAFMRVKETPRKVVFFNIHSNNGTLKIFHKHQNKVLRSLIVFQHGAKSPTVLKSDTLLMEKENIINMSICPDKREIGLYVKFENNEYADYFHPKFCKNSRLWALFELQDGIYLVLFDSTKSKMDFGFQWLDNSAPNPFDLMSIGAKSKFKFNINN